MIASDGFLRCAALDGRVRIEASAPFSLEALFLGSPGRPSWSDLRALGPFRFSTESCNSADECSSPWIERDFADSVLSCGSGGNALVDILPRHEPSNSLRIPSAMDFAFAQQWAQIGHVCFHGALLRVDGKGVLVVGTRAAGKSVLSASALAAGGAIVTDDYLLLGENGGDLVGERIRRFLSLRLSWAADSLISGSDEPWAVDRSGRRAFLRLESNDERFPPFSPIDRIWVLRRPRSGRQDQSALEKISHADVHAAIVSAIQPLLLGRDFPRERKKLLALIARLVSSVPAARIETGQDIVREPRSAWTRLLHCQL
jgi:hypothetical protein